MRNIRNLSSIKSTIRNSGVTVKNSPSLEYPIPVAVFYRNNADGTVSWFWPKGNRETALTTLLRHSSSSVKWVAGVYNAVFSLGMEGLLAHGKLILYTDVPTAAFLQHQWRRSEN
jgi:hypothetical protein